MTRKPTPARTPRKTRAQLKTTVWPDRASALRDLKASQVPAEGEDYVLAEYRPGSWQLVARDAAPAVQPSDDPVEQKVRPADPDPTPQAPTPQAGAAIREQIVIDSLRKKPGVKPRAEPVVLVTNGATPPPAPERVAARELPPAWPEPSLDLSALPSEDGPYELVLSEAISFPRFSAVTSALEVSRKLKVAVLIRNASAETERVIDWAVIRKRQAESKRTAASGDKRTGRQASPDSKFARAARLLFRPNGATGKQLEAECDWPRVTQRHVNKASRLNNDAAIEVLGERHWRLIKRD